MSYRNCVEPLDNSPDDPNNYTLCMECLGLGEVVRPLNYRPRYEWVTCPVCCGTGYTSDETIRNLGQNP